MVAAWYQINQVQPEASRNCTIHAYSALEQEVRELKTQFEALQLKQKEQDHRLDNLDSVMAANHSEVMAALRGLSAQGSSSASTELKRQSELLPSPLKAMTGAKPSKQSRT